MARLKRRERKRWAKIFGRIQPFQIHSARDLNLAYFGSEDELDNMGDIMRKFFEGGGTEKKSGDVVN